MSKTDTEVQETPPAEKRGKATLVIALTIGMMIGAGAGSLVVGPLLAESKGGDGGHAGPATGADLKAQCATLIAEWETEERPPAPSTVYTLENLVLNPARSGGTRYLMASVGFGMRDPLGAENMTARDAEIRDIVIRILGSKTIPELSDTAVRTTIKEEIRTEVSKRVGDYAIIDVYFPQFVIQ